MWEKGQSGNPRGRPRKRNSLTEILARAGSATVPDGEDRHISRKRLLARMLWELATTGRIRFPDGTEIQIEDTRDWLDVVDRIYNRIEGKPGERVDIGATVEAGDRLVGVMGRIAQALGREDDGDG